MIPWEINADSYTNCNCAYGCPCQFNALPTYGNCEAVHSMQIESGHFGDVKLDGLKTVAVLWWPGPIHEGGGKVFAIVDEGADEAQRNALLTILTGQETDPGATIWNVFSATFDEVMEPVFMPIDIQIDIPARKSSVKVEGFVNATGIPILNPVSGEEHQAAIQLNNGFEYSVAEMGAGTATVTGPLPLELNDSYGQFNEIHINNHGIIKH
jgi:hypothetical protein